MKILHINTTDIDGGAGIATYRLRSALSQQKIDSSILVNKKFSNFDFVRGPDGFLEFLVSKTKYKLDQLILKLYPNRSKQLFSPHWFPSSITKKINQIDPNIVHLHWISGGFVDIKNLSKINRPIVWTLHDMWPLTGGCHYSNECEKFASECGQCPILNSNQSKDLSFKILKKKSKYLSKLNIHFIGSKFLDGRSTQKKLSF